MPAISEFVQALLDQRGAYRYVSEYVTPGESAHSHILDTQKDDTQKHTQKDTELLDPPIAC